MGREKRRAGVFHLPPSSDDNSSSEINQSSDSKSNTGSHENLSDRSSNGHVAPVKFIPSFLRREYSQRRVGGDAPQESQSSSLTSLNTANHHAAAAAEEVDSPSLSGNSPRKELQNKNE